MGKFTWRRSRLNAKGVVKGLWRNKTCRIISRRYISWSSCKRSRRKLLPLVSKCHFPLSLPLLSLNVLPKRVLLEFGVRWRWVCRSDSLTNSQCLGILGIKSHNQPITLNFPFFSSSVVQWCSAHVSEQHRWKAILKVEHTLCTKTKHVRLAVNFDGFYNSE
jgi:hypothetical protein